MRNVYGFTDGRIHVTLLDGAFDLRVLSEGDMEVYHHLVERWVEGGSLVEFENMADMRLSSFPVAMRLSHRQPLVALFVDFCRRLALEEAGANDLLDEMRPWRPEESRALFERATGYAPLALPRAA